MQEAQIVFHINLPATEKVGLAFIEMVRTVFESKITQAQLNELNTALGSNVDKISDVLNETVP